MLGAESKLVSGGRGELTIWVDGVKVFDKARYGDFPSDDEAIAAVRSASPSP